MKTKHKMSAILAILLLIISIFTVIQLPVIASGSADVWVDSAAYSYNANDIGDTSLMPVMVNSTDKVVTWEANFTFDPKILQCTGVIQGSYIPSPTSFTSGTIDNVAGTITGVNCTATGGQNATGRGVLAYLVLTIKSYGTTNITIDINMINTAASPIAVTETDGYFGMALTVSLPSVSYLYNTSDIGDPVVMPLEIKASPSTSWGGVISWEANFTFDSNILNCTNVVEGSYLKSGGSTSFASGTIDNVAGTITGVNCTATGGQNATGSGVLASLVFTVIDVGSTDVNITAISVIVGDPHEALVNAVDGYFEMGLKVSLPTVNWWYAEHDLGEVFVMELSIEAPEAANWTGGVVSWQANFSFNPNILNCIGVSNGTYLAGPYLNWTNTFTNGTIDNNAGTVTGVNGTLTQAGKNATGSGILAYLAFNVTGTGSTDVTIADCTVLVSGPREAPPTLIHGHFALGITLSLPTVNWWYPDHNIGDIVVMELKIVTPELYAWQVGVTFDPNVLQCLSVSQGPYPPGAGTIGWGAIDNVNGVVMPFGCYLFGGVGAGPTGAGGAVLATLTFNVTGFGSTTIAITNCWALSPVCTRIIPLTVIDGYFEWRASVSVVPSTDVAVAGQSFTVNITVSLAVDLYLWAFSISWNPATLDLVDVTEGDFLKKGGSTTGVLIKEINQTGGYMREAACSLLGSVPGVNGSGTLATLTFKATAVGSSPLDIYFCDLLNSTGESISLNTTDSSVDIDAPDLSISNVSLPYPDQSLYVNTTVSVNVTVQSTGNVSATAFNVSLTAYWNDGEIVDYFGKLTVDGLEPNTTRTLQFTFTLHYTGNYTLTFNVDCDNDVIELNETNNELTLTIKVKMQGDIDGDNEVTYLDLFDLSRAYWSTPEDTNWNPYADINNDGKVDYNDLFLLAQNYSLP